MAEGTPVVSPPLTDWVGWSWRMVWKKPESIAVFFVAGLCMNALVVPASIAATVLEASGGSDGRMLGLLVRIGANVLNFPISVFFAMGMARYALHVARGEPAGFKDIFSSGPYLSYLGATFVIALATVAGLLLCIVPGIFLAICWMFTGLAIVDRRLGAFEAMRASWDLTKGHRWELLLFLLIAFGVNLLGFLACCVGAFVTSAMTQIALAWVYLRLGGKEAAAV